MKQVNVKSDLGSCSHDDNTAVSLDELAVTKSHDQLKIFSALPDDVIVELEQSAKEVANDKDFNESLAENLRKFALEKRNLIEVKKQKKEKKEYSPEQFLMEANGYLNQKVIDCVQSAEKAWASFSCSVALFFQKIGINLANHNATVVLSYAMVEYSTPQYSKPQKELFNARGSAFSAHHHFYRSTTKQQCLEFILNVTKFVESKEFKPAVVEQKIKEQKIEGKEDWIFTNKKGSVKLVYKFHEDKIFGKNFKFRYSAE